jgi:DNA-binding PadR family transcriptional regulator
MPTAAALGGRGDITRTVVLGALALSPMHGYELKGRLAQWHMELWAGVQAGSIYAMLARLEREGLIEKAGTGRTGNRPERQSFRITLTGRDELRRLLHELWTGAGRLARPIDVAVSFFRTLDPREISGLLEQRLDSLAQLIAAFEAIDQLEQEPADAAIDLMVHDLIAHELDLARAEHAWTARILERFRAGGYDAITRSRGGR